jgi:hypothetical protein
MTLFNNKACQRNPCGIEGEGEWSNHDVNISSMQIEFSEGTVKSETYLLIGICSIRCVLLETDSSQNAFYRCCYLE